MASKIIVIGSVNSSFRDVFKKLEKLQAKQNFAFAIVLGDLFGESSSGGNDGELTALLKGEIQVPLPTYFTVGCRMMPREVVDKLEKADGELCPNLFYLGRRGVLTTSEGVKIVALGGTLETSASAMPGVNDKYAPRYTEYDAKSLYGTQTADILVTYQWPKSVQEGSKVPLEGGNPVEGVQCLADLCSTLKPRYHFSSYASQFFEREPFFHQHAEVSPDVHYITRFINLAPCNNLLKQKWMYAFNLDPKAPQPAALPTGTTVSPFVATSSKRQALPAQNEAYSRFSHDDGFQRPRKRARRAPPGPSECFFCLSNPNVATHLITSIGSECYLTTAKGPLPTPSSFPELGFPCHMLIIPLTHAPTFGAMDDVSSRDSTFNEMQRYRSALHTMLQERCSNKLGAVTWEVSRSGGVHLHWQFMPVHTELIERGLVETAFIVEADNLKYPKFTRSKPDTMAESGDYFRLWIWKPSGASNKEPTQTPREVKSESENTLVLPLSRDFRFDLQFGRIVMAKIMGLEKRADWKEVTQSQSEETTDAESFKKAFQKFDFSLTEE
ncbi:hypothetical protein VTO42DRAFT_252 [Malbranchea cinnamomea]